MGKKPINPEITSSDVFRSMSTEAQLLYFHLVLGADEDGVVNSSKAILGSLGFSNSVLQELAQMRFVLLIGPWVVIKHSRLHNSIQKLRHLHLPRVPDLAKQLYVRPDGVYTDHDAGGYETLWDEKIALLSSVGQLPREMKRKERKERKETTSFDKEVCTGASPRGHTPGPASARGDTDAEPSLQMLQGKLGQGVVMLTDEQMERLLDKMGLEVFDHYVNKLATYLNTTGYRLKSHYKTILRWWRQDTQVEAGEKDPPIVPEINHLKGELP